MTAGQRCVRASFPTLSCPSLCIWPRRTPLCSRAPVPTYLLFIELCGWLHTDDASTPIQSVCAPMLLLSHAPQIIHSALPTLDSHDPACSFFFFCSASLQIAGGQTRGDDAALRLHLAATLSFLAVLCITISLPLACSSGGVMYLPPHRQPPLTLTPRCTAVAATHFGESESTPCFAAAPSLISVSSDALKPPIAATCCSRLSCDRRVRTVTRMLFALPALALPLLSMATLITPAGGEQQGKGLVALLSTCTCL